MPQFDNTVITTAGSRIIQQSLADEGSIKWSRLVTSSHAFEDTVDLRSVTSIPNIKQEAEYGDFTVYLSSVGDVTVKHYFSNREVTVGYTCETIALYAEYESEEVVACIIRSTAHDTIPPYDGKNPSGVSVTLALRFQDTPDFEVIFSDAGTVSDADFAHYQAWVAKEYVTKVEHESTLDEIGDPALLARLSEEGATNWDSENFNPDVKANKDSVYTKEEIGDPELISRLPDKDAVAYGDWNFDGKYKEQTFDLSPYINTDIVESGFIRCTVFGQKLSRCYIVVSLKAPLASGTLVTLASGIPNYVRSSSAAINSAVSLYSPVSGREIGGVSMNVNGTIVITVPHSINNDSLTMVRCDFLYMTNEELETGGLQ